MAGTLTDIKFGLDFLGMRGEETQREGEDGGLN